jgi:hypothetical protein
MQELVQEGYKGVLLAVEKYDPAKGTPPKSPTPSPTTLCTFPFISKK